eukprot:CAMPEP_0114993448 /NCGR_PEP_ID=MMETSP0216-20121206/12535_1 /TAXON_ID=223996 /ORGANISM="Protocruzia adherens, Strain Boccale" /LENGTH=299 /DNA_ID=CAMNT_0002357091 /DNA_START=58 /DNA_END=957 /DNA_ORIENTATION=-
MSGTDPNKALKKADGYMKTTLTRWKPDHVSAAIYYEQAAEGFKLLDDKEKAIISYERLANVNEQLNDFWATGRACQEAGQLLLELKDAQCLAHLERAAQLFFGTNNHDKGLQMLLKCAEFHQEQGDLEGTKSFYEQGKEHVVNENLVNQLQMALEPYMNFLIENEMYAEAIDVYQAELDIAESGNKQSKIIKDSLAIVALHLLLKDDVSAKIALSDFSAKYGSFSGAMESEVARKLIDAYQDGDQEEFKKQATRSVWSNVEAQIYRKVRRIQVPPKTAVIEATTDSTGEGEATGGLSLI